MPSGAQCLQASEFWFPAEFADGFFAAATNLGGSLGRRGLIARGCHKFDHWRSVILSCESSGRDLTIQSPAGCGNPSAAVGQERQKDFDDIFRGGGCAFTRMTRNVRITAAQPNSPKMFVKRDQCSFFMHGVFQESARRRLALGQFQRRE